MRTREEVLWFAKEMENKLQENDHKGGWQDESYSSLFNMLEKEVRELCSALIDNRSAGSELEDVRSEAADVANFAMMIADKARRERRRC